MKRPLHSIAYSVDDIRENIIPLDLLSSKICSIVADQEFALIMARLEPDNQILEIIRAFSHERRDYILCVAGRFDPTSQKYHRDLLSCASDQVFFLGGVYDNNEKVFLRNNSIVYLHGHTVGGTNPSLVEAIGSKSPIIAHRNHFNVGVAKDGAIYFENELDLQKLFQHLPKEALKVSRRKADLVYNDFKHCTINEKYLRVIQMLKKLD